MQQQEDNSIVNTCNIIHSGKCMHLVRRGGGKSGERAHKSRGVNWKLPINQNDNEQQTASSKQIFSNFHYCQQLNAWVPDSLSKAMHIY